MRRPVSILFSSILLGSVFLTSCTSSTPSTPPPPVQLPAQDPAVLEVLPTGSFQATADIYLGAFSLPAWRLSGYVEFRGTDCAMDLEFTQADGLFKDAYDASTYAQFIEANPLVPLPSRAATTPGTSILGVPAVQSLVKPFKETSFAKVSRPAPSADVWVDAADPLFPLVDPSNALPTSLLLANLPRLTPVPGTGPVLCSIPLLPYLTTSTTLPVDDAPGDGTTLSLRYSESKFCAFESAALVEGESRYRASLSLTDSESETLTAGFTSLRSMCGFSASAPPHELHLSRQVSGSYRLSMTTNSGVLLYELLLQPTSPRLVPLPTKVSRYLDALPGLRRDGLTIDDLFVPTTPSYPR